MEPSLEKNVRVFNERPWDDERVFPTFEQQPGNHYHFLTNSSWYVKQSSSKQAGMNTMHSLARGNGSVTQEVKKSRPRLYIHPIVRKE